MWSAEWRGDDRYSTRQVDEEMYWLIDTLDGWNVERALDAVQICSNMQANT